MKNMTMSFSKGKKSETSIKHNNRSLDPNFDFDKKRHQHIEREYTSLNEVLVHRDIRDIYKRINLRDIEILIDNNAITS